MIRALLFAILCAAPGGCASAPERAAEEQLVGVNMTREEIYMYGTRRYAGKPTDVFKACVQALRGLGYEIVSEQLEKGVIISGRKLVRVQASFFGGVGGVLTYTRQFVLRLFDDPPTGKVVVSALPKLFENDFDVSEKPIWDLRGERAIWRDLFMQIDLLSGHH